MSLEIFYNINSLALINFWKEADANALDISENKEHLYKKLSFISKLFIIYNDNTLSCIKFNFVKIY